MTSDVRRPARRTRGIYSLLAAARWGPGKLAIQFKHGVKKYSRQPARAARRSSPSLCPPHPPHPHPLLLLLISSPFLGHAASSRVCRVPACAPTLAPAHYACPFVVVVARNPHVNPHRLTSRHCYCATV
ncbi:hypothetical protein L226DRAFT_83493 [Lentinus tigrinus ALCF2SS1-7]|uniref:uncharacterized protein n=1 Tax=Lentinus tigrinus ALCF2SS1-7 TaxID=1328758 RepID=UPI00116629B2|nr:hypothetical protein L226DRAFT_83493 [Lentinus tigrinus ALCF2SS1-7]